jgi:hypothetical protein
MDRYVNRYIVPPPQQPQQPQQQQQQGFYNPQHGQPPQHPQQSSSPAPPPPSHPHNYMVGCYPNANGWTGVPLISTASRRPRKFGGGNGVGHHDLNRSLSLNAADFDEHSITRLALHAHGAPLIFSGRYRCKNNNGVNKKEPRLTVNNNNPNTANNNHASKDEFVKSGGYANFAPAVVAADANSTTSDENVATSGSSNSSVTNSPDTCLPRIIKPRKRRKKDRKPQPGQENPTAPSPAPVVATPQPNVPKANACGSKGGNEVPTNKQYCGESASPAPPIQFHVQFQHFTPDTTPPPADTNNPLSSCSCRLCDPFCKIWAFPLRRSCSDNSAETNSPSASSSVASSSASSSNSSINRNVGVIGGNRSSSARSEWKSTPQSLDILVDYSGSRKGSFSDSGDSGCDLLGGIHFSDDLLSNVGKDMFLTPTDAGKEFQFPPPAGAKAGLESTIFNESINELSRKLSESLELKSDSVSSSDSGSVFSDGVPDLFMNFDSISRNYLFSAGNISKLSSLLFDDSLAGATVSPTTSAASAKNLPQMSNSNNNNNHNNNCQMTSVNNNSTTSSCSSNVNCSNNVKSLFSEPIPTVPQPPFIFVPDKDRGTEILNCFDMVWNPQKLLPVEE